MSFGILFHTGCGEHELWYLLSTIRILKVKLVIIRTDPVLKFTATIYDCVLITLEKRLTSYFEITPEVNKAITAVVIFLNINILWVNNYYSKDVDEMLLKNLLFII